MVQPFKIVRPDHCFLCNSDRSLELYFNDRALNYSLYIDQINNGKNIDIPKFEYIKCRRCKKGTNYPRYNKSMMPMLLENIDIVDDFITLFRKDMIK